MLVSAAYLYLRAGVGFYFPFYCT